MHQVDDGARRKALAEFLRSRRERLHPAAAGLRSTGRRRTPGLRREEVAELAGIGTAWYTWLEQARDIRPSEGAIRQIARALQLNDTERRYLLDVAFERAPIKHREEIVTPFLLSTLNSFDGPAYVVGQRWDLLAFNDTANAVFDFDQIPDRNLLRNLFGAASQLLLPNWEYVAQQHVAMFRAQNAALLKDPWIMQLVTQLQESSEQFAAWWSEQAVTEAQSGHKTYEHPLAGRLSFDFSTLLAADSPNLHLIVYVPDDDTTKANLEAFVASKRNGQVHATLWETLTNLMPSVAW